MVKLDIEFPDYMDISERTTNIQKRTIQLAADDLTSNLTDNSPVDQGKLKSWRSYKISDMEYHVKTPADYAQYPDQGTKAHGPKHKKVLAFKPSKNSPIKSTHKSGLVFFKKVKGIKAKKFVDKSLDQTKGKLDSIMIQAALEVDGVR